MDRDRAEMQVADELLYIPGDSRPQRILRRLYAQRRVMQLTSDSSIPPGKTMTQTLVAIDKYLLNFQYTYDREFFSDEA